MSKQPSFEQLVNALSVGVCVFDGEQRVTYVNAKLADMLGSAPDALLGKDVSELFEFPHAQVPAVEGTQGACLRNGNGKTSPVATIAQSYEEGMALIVMPASALEAVRWGTTQDRLARVEQLLDRVERIHGSSPPQSHERDLSASPLLAQLSRREREIVTALVAARPVKQIAASLNISPHTVRNHLKSSFRKLNVGSQVELVAKLTQGPAMVSSSSAG